MIIAHGPWPPAPDPDISNRFSGDDDAIRFGRALFHDARLSADGSMQCATCHEARHAMGDGKPRALGRRELDRNTPALANLSGRRWFGWDGRSDNLWAQSIHPILNPDELAQDENSLARRIIEEADLARTYLEVTGRSPVDDPPREVLVNIAKSLAAWQETLVTPRTAFDRFRDALAEDRDVPDNVFSRSARRGLKLFVGEGRCSLCHFGPNFSNDEFHHAGVPHFTRNGSVDPGRHGGIGKYRASPYRRTGKFSDEDPESAARAPGNFVVRSHDDWGRFRVPSLRNVAATAPYMHDGSVADLPAVVRHYDEINMNLFHEDGESLLRPLGLDATGRADLEAFLRTLTGDPVTATP